MNLLKIAEQKKAKLMALKSVKLTAVKNDDKIVLAQTGVIVPSSEVIHFENGHVNVSGLFAAQASLKEALSLNKI